MRSWSPKPRRAAWFNPLIVFGAAAGLLLTLLNVACCTWIERQWGGWIAVAWITRGSDAWYTLAAALANAIIVVALARFIGGQPVAER